MATYNRSFKRRKFKAYRKKESIVGKIIGIILAMLFIILLVAIAGVMFFSADSGGDDSARWGSEKLLFEVSGPSEVSSGGNVEYTISLKNEGNINLQQGELSISFPKGFVLDASSPEFDQEVSAGGVWKIDEIKAYGSKEFSVNGQLFGDIDETKVVSFAMSYRPENFSSSFLDTSSYETKINASLLDLSFNLSDEVMSGQEVNNTIKITKSANSEFDTSRLKVVMEHPDDFELINSNYPENETGDRDSTAFIISDFGNSATLKITSIFSGDDNEKKVVMVRVYSLDSDGEESPEIIQLRKVTYVSKPALDLELLIEESAAGSQSFKWEDKIDFKIVYKNDWDQSLEDLMLKVSFDGDDVFDWETVKFYGNIDKSFVSEIDRGQMFIFNKAIVSDFEKFEAGQESNLRFKMSIDEKAVNSDDSLVKVKAEITCGDFKIESNEIEMNIR